jgi:hypothetical protein
MRSSHAVLLGFAVSCLASLTYLCWPRQERRGWFELAGTPVRLDGQTVQDWQHVNDLLARPVADLHARIEAIHAANARGGHVAPEFLDREFLVEYRPAARPDTLQRTLVRRYMSSAFWGGNSHPTGYARHELVADETRSAR